MKGCIRYGYEKMVLDGYQFYPAEMGDREVVKYEFDLNYWCDIGMLLPIIINQ